MSHKQRSTRPSPMTAVLVVIFLSAGIAAIVASLWM